MRRTSVAAVLVAMTGVATSLVATSPVSASAPSAVVGTVPAGNRYDPRAVTVLGANADGFVYRQETDQGFNQPGGGSLAYWQSFAGGDNHSLGNESGTVVGDHLVRLNTSEGPNTVTDTPLPSGTPTTVSIPSGDTVLSATGDGVVVASQSGALGLMPWGATTVTPIPGLPVGAGVYAVSGPTTMTAHGALLQVAPSTGGLALWYVDTSAPHAWQLTSSTAYGAAISAAAITWIQPSSDGTTEQLAAVAVPQPGDASAATPTLRNAAVLNDQSPSQWTTLAVGGSVLLWQLLDPQQYTRDLASPLYSVASNGTVTTAATWAHGLQPLVDGQHALLVSGNTPTTEQISELASGSTTLSQVLQIAPIVGRTGQLAVDGNRVVRIDDGAPDGAVVVNTVAASGGALSVGADQQLATGAQQASAGNCNPGLCASVAAAGTSTSYLDPDNDHLVTYSGTTKVADTALNGQDGQIRGTDGQEVLLDSRNAVYDSLYTVATGTEALTALMKPTLAAGYLYGYAPNTDETAFTALNLSSGARTSIPLPSGCTDADMSPQAAGPYLLLKCHSTEQTSYDTWAVIDQQDATKSWVDKLTPTTVGQWWLGDGFAVSADSSGNLAWTDLSDASHTWQPLAGTWGAVPGTFAVDGSGTQATVAWVDTNGLTHVAILPIAATAPHPTALTTSPSSTVAAGTTTTLSTTLTDSTNSVGLAGQPLYLLQRTSPKAKFTLAATVGTNPAGSTTVHAKPTQTTQYAWYFAGTSMLTASASGITVVSVAQEITATAVHTKVKTGKPITIYGTVTPMKAGQHALFQQKEHGQWVTLSKKAEKTQTLPNHARAFGYVVTRQETKAGTYQFRVEVAASSTYASAISNAVTVKVTG